MARRYGIHICANGKREPWNCTCDPGEGEGITAIDGRDVEPLVEALTEIVGKNTCDFKTEDDDCLSLGASVRCARCIAVEALATFETEEPE